MRLQDHIDFTTLQWVKPELDETLSRARNALESYADRPDDRDAMRSCVNGLHQVHGTLQMVELYGAALVADEMEALALALLEDHVPKREEAYAVLMRGLMQLPDYLERLSSGHRDVPVVLLPLLNDLRAARQLDALSEAAMFNPRLETALPADAPGAASEAEGAAGRGQIADLRLRFQHQLLAWFRGQQAQQQLAGMRDTLDAIAARCFSVPGRRLWWIAAGAIEGLEQGMLQAQAADVRQLIGKVDRCIRQLIEQGEASLRGGDADELARQLLYIVAQARQRSPLMERLRQTYALDSLLPDAAELEHARGSMSGHNRALLDSVARALKDDLLRVKEALDLFLRQDHADPAQLSMQGEVLERVGDTLGMLALAPPRRVVDEQRRIIDDIANRLRAPDDETLLDVAGALLYVEASLDDHIESLGAESGQAGVVDIDHSRALPRSEARHILAALMQEAIVNTARVKEAVVAFVESGWQHGHLAAVPPLMDEVGGAMRMLSRARPAGLADGIGRFVGNELLADLRVPDSAQMDHLADALAALEYYLEAAREHRGGLEHILDVAEHSLSMLGYWPVPPVRQAVAADPAALVETPRATLGLEEELTAHPALSETVSLTPGAELSSLFMGPNETPPLDEHDLRGLRLAETGGFEGGEPAGSAAGDDDDWVEIEEEVIEQRPVLDRFASNAGFQISSEGIDDDIREIFLEEMQEEIDHLRQAEQAWLADPAQLSSLASVRRSFHTLKGSGRLVGASTLGEFAWRIEDMLNRVLDHTIPPHEGVQDLLRHAIEALPQMLLALRGEGVPSAPLGAIMQTAERLAAGEQATLADRLPAATETVRHVVRRRVPRNEIDGSAIPAAALAGRDGPASVEDAFRTAAHESIGLPVMPPVDPVLLEILRSEVAQYLQAIRAAMGRSGDELHVDDALLRAVHTLHGAIAMVDIPLLIQLLSPLEGLLKRLRAAGKPLPAEGVRLLGQSADVVDQVMAQFDLADPRLPDVSALVARLGELRDSQPEPSVAHIVFDPHADEAAAVATDDGADGRMEEAAATSLDAGMAEALALLPGVALSDGTAESVSDAEHDQFAEELMAALDSFDPRQHGAPDDAGIDVVHDGDEESPEPSSGDLPDDPGLPYEAAAPAPAGQSPAETHDESVDTPANVAEDETPLVDEAAGGTEIDTSPAEAPIEVDMRATPAATELPTTFGVAEESWAPAPVAAAADIDEPHVTAAPAAADEPAPVADIPRWRGHIDPDLLEIFTEEAREILDHADGELALWHAEPSDVGHVAGLQRDLHTLKGGARIAGLIPVGDLAHAIETLLEKPLGTDATQNAQLIGILEGGFDQLHALVQQISQGQAIAYPQTVIDQLLALAGQEALVERDDAEAASPWAGPVPAAEPASRTHADFDLPEPLPELLPDDTGDASRSPQEQIRVRADLLDDLVNHAGEVAIYRSRLEQQVSGYRFNLVELEQTVARLRSQLRMLEIETEAQIIARFQRENREAGIGVFDPLELDRFSQLQQYSRALAESVSDLVSIQNMLDELTRQAETLLIQQSRVSSELQEGLLRTRMLPFDTMVPNLRRTLRQAAQEDGKSAQLYVEGAHGEMDRNLLDRLKAPFEHMLRNAVAHGIETPAERRATGKPEEGAVRIRVAREATEVVVRVSDDGRGLDREGVRQRAVERGLLPSDAQPGDDQLLALITQPGFSTAGQVTQLAGRGVGMDVVATEIKQLGGSLAVESAAGAGTTFVLRLPFTLAVTQAILVRVGESTFAIPMTSVQGVSRITPDELAGHLAADEPLFQHNGEQYGIHDLAALLGVPAGHAPDETQVPLLLTRAGELRAAIRIDAVIGSREIVVKSVGPQISSVPGLLGATIMGDGSVLVILDLAPLVRHGIARRQQQLADGPAVAQPSVAEEARVRPLVMVVDDSITMRKVTGRVLERNEYEVSTAKDGVDAVEKLAERVPDLMLLDIEMPRMDGYELATHMKADPRLRQVPIIMITSRTGEKHRQRALDIGVERYLGKPYQEAELLALIGEVLRQGVRESTHG